MVHRRQDGERGGEVLQAEHGAERSQRGQDQYGSAESLILKSLCLSSAPGVFQGNGHGQAGMTGSCETIWMGQRCTYRHHHSRALKYKYGGLYGCTAGSRDHEDYQELLKTVHTSKQATKVCATIWFPIVACNIRYDEHWLLLRMLQLLRMRCITFTYKSLIA